MSRPHLYALLAAVALGSCGSPTAPPSDVDPPAPTSSANSVAPAPADPAVRPAEPAPDLVAATAPTAAPAGHDFAPQAAALYRVAACGSDSELADRFERRIIDRHCKTMNRRYDRYRKRWLDRAMPFLAELRPDDLPARVVYPFGGGDLVSALATFPDAAEITTISLEAAGDPRTIDELSRRALKEDLSVVAHVVGRLLGAAHSTTKSLQKASHSKLPGTLVFALAGLAIHGHEPVRMRYFQIRDDGSLHYLSLADLEEGMRAFRELAREQRDRERELRRKKLQVWRQQVAVFANVEIEYRPRGSAAGAPTRIYRHIVANLDDPHLAAGPGLIRHLESKGPVAAMTKAASYLLWMPEFSTVRNYLLGNMVWMISDSSGIPPRYAQPAGFEQIAYGDYDGPYFYYSGRTVKQLRDQMQALWDQAASARRKLPFRYGYPDSTRKGNHLMITRKP